MSGGELPSGTVTFLFTDIEGSTRLLKQLGDRYGELLREQQRILREAAAAHDGREVDTQGDSFFFAFPRANAALAATVVAQRNLAAFEWPDGAEVRVRMGLHTGEPTVGDERYVGLGVHRAARIGAVGHGGQVLLSNPTRELVELEREGTRVRELGLFKLKDIDRPERLFQLDIDGLQTDFPPIRAEKVSQPRPLRRRAILLAALAGVIAAAVAIPIFAFGQGGSDSGPEPKAAEGNSLGIVDSRSGHLIADPGVGATPTHVAYGQGAYWVTNADANSVSKIDPATRAVIDTIPNVGHSPSGITVGNGDVWVANSLDGTVVRIDPHTDTIAQTIDVGNGPTGITAGAGSIWVANTADGTITKIDAATGRPTKTAFPVAATELAYGAGALWATQHTTNQVARIDPRTGDAVSVQVGNGPTGIAFGDGTAWVANSLDGTVSRIDPDTNTVEALIPVGDGATGVAYDADGVWVSNEYGGTLVKIDPRTNLPGKPIRLGGRPQGIAVANGNVLVGVSTAFGAGHRGGTLTMLMNFPPDSIDTAIAYTTSSWPILRMTNDGLVAFNQASGLAGAQLVPDLSESLPAPTDGGRTYTFRMRPNIRFSTGQPVRPSDVRATFERYYALGKPPVTYYDGIVGAAECKKHPSSCELSQGIIANDGEGTVSFHLVAADPEFLFKLALPFAYILPQGTPAKPAATHPLPASGPYMITVYSPNHRLTLGRNPYFREWSQAAQPAGFPNQIDVRINTRASTDSLMNKVVGGEGDLVTGLSTNGPTQRGAAEILTRYPSQIHSNPEPGTSGFFLNTHVAPFNRLAVRRALNYAADRAAAVDRNGGPELATPTCQILPSGFPGYRPYCPYTRDATAEGKWNAPDLTKARALINRSGTRGMKVTVWVDNYTRTAGASAMKLLRTLGYRPSLKVIQNKTGFIYFGVVGNSRNKAQMGIWGWDADYPAASNFFLNQLTCTSFTPNNPNNPNTAEFCDPKLDRQVRQALAQEATNPVAANQLWTRIDRQLVDQAPVIPLVSNREVDVVSSRVGNYQYADNGLGALIDQLWVR